MYTPNIVEYQCGSNVISQSNAAKLIVNAKTTVPKPDHFRSVSSDLKDEYLTEW